MSADALSRLLLAVHDGDLDVPIPGAGRLLRQALASGLVSCPGPVRYDGKPTASPARITKKGVRHLRAVGLIGYGETGG